MPRAVSSLFPWSNNVSNCRPIFSINSTQRQLPDYFPDTDTAVVVVVVAVVVVYDVVVYRFCATHKLI